MRTLRFMKSVKLLRMLGAMPDCVINIFAAVCARYSLFKISHYHCPPQLTIFLTEKCNLNCPHCFLGDMPLRPLERLEINDIKELCRKNKKYVRRIILTGGEIFLLPDIEEICFLLDREMLLENLTIATSGVFPEKVFHLAEQFLEKGKTMLSLQISLDGPPQFHDAFRGATGLFQKAVNLAQGLSEKFTDNPHFERVYFCVVLNKKNISLLPETIDCVNNLGIDVEWGFMRSVHKSVSKVPAEFLGLWAPQHDELMLSVTEMEKAYHILKERFWRKKAVTPSDAISCVRMKRVIEYYKTTSWKTPCVAGRADVVISPQGRVALCEMTRTLASLRDYAWDLCRLVSETHLDVLAREWGCSCAHECNIGNALRIDASGISEILHVLSTAPG